MITFNSTFEYKLIYIFRINDKAHRGCLKIGDATIHTSKDFSQLHPNCHDLNHAARERIDSYTVTAGIAYELLHTELAILEKNGKYKAFRDHKVHSVLKRSGINVKYFDTNKKQNEWFITDLNTAKLAIQAVKDGFTALNGSKITNDINPIIFRPEQNDAIKKTIARFKSGNKMLWNAKMRFGKTLTALEVAKQMNFKRTIIITHRPVVSDGWFEDFNKIFYDKPDYYFGSKTKGKIIEDLLKNDNNFVYFASMQDLRGSDAVGGNFDKNNEIFKIDWDFVVVDEAHEGTKTELGKNVLKAVIKEENSYKTYVLELSGTPFNLLTDFEQESIYTWDYIMEQEAKTTWDKTHFGDSNPYEELPRMNIFTYHLEKSLPVYIDVMDKAFNFREFFRLWTGDIQKDGKAIPKGVGKGTFVHEDDVKAFLDLICKKDDSTNYPFATKEYQNFFRHSLWVVPGVKEAKALSDLLKHHHIFKNFKIVNVAGDGDEEIDTSNALHAVKNAMTDNPDQTYTITLSCGRLTTGVSVPEWTAVLMLAGTYSTAASQYLQTIFRVQTPANINGKMKEECFVFDFAPDRTLKMVAESVQLSARAGANNSRTEVSLDKFLNYCPVIAIEDSNMKEYKVSELLQELKKAYAERVARNGFDDPKIYNDQLLKLTEVELKDFQHLKEIVGASKQTKKADQININNEGFSDEETEEEKKLKKKPKNTLSEEEKKRLAELKEKRKNRDAAISILRAISIRMPLLVYGMDIDINADVTIDNFADLIDDVSWEEFMPKGVDKKMFKKFSKYYDKDIFIAASRRIRYIAKTADELEPIDRVKKIASLFASFKNPDKETVLTPWRVVNMHLSETIGGYDFYDEKHESLINEPRFVKHDNVTSEIFNTESKILEINSKSGLYPLYVAFSLYQTSPSFSEKLSFEEKQKLWDEIVKKQIFVICKTPMAKLITKRTLLGYRDGKVNMHAFDDLIMQLKEKQQKFINKITKKSFWEIGGTGNMKFDAVVGNPPYQGTNHQQIYPYFYLTSKLIGQNISLIFPIGWQEPKTANNLGKMNVLEVKKDKQIVFIDNRQNVFPGISGAEWTNIILWKKNYDNGLEGCQLIYTNGENPEEKELPLEISNTNKPVQIINLGTLIKNGDDFETMMGEISANKPYGLRKNIIGNYAYYHLPIMFDAKHSENDLTLYASNSRKVYCPIDYPLPKISNSLNSYKVFIPSAWGNMSENSGLGGAYSDIILAGPKDICTETFVEFGNFKTHDIACKAAKYVLTKFVRALIYLNKISQQSSKSVWEAVPIQTFSEEWWNESVSQLDDRLFDKYNVPENIREFVKKNIQSKSESNIVNFFDSSITFECKDNDSLARGNFKNSNFIVLKGSRVSDHLAPSFEQYDKTNYDLRVESENDGTIKDRIVQKDISFSSQSAATAFVTGHIANGSEWKKR